MLCMVWVGRLSTNDFRRRFSAVFMDLAERRDDIIVTDV